MTNPIKGQLTYLDIEKHRLVKEIAILLANDHKNIGKGKSINHTIKDSQPDVRGICHLTNNNNQDFHRSHSQPINRNK